MIPQAKTYSHTLEGWLAPDGMFTQCWFGPDNSALDHTMVARNIIADLYPDEYNRQYFTAQRFLLEHGYLRLDIHSIGKQGSGWGGLSQWQVWELHKIYNLKPKRRFFPYTVVRLLLVANGVDYLRQGGDNEILSGCYISVEGDLA